MFKSILNDAQEITDFIIDLSNDYVDVEFIREHFVGCKAVLKTVPIENLIEGNKYNNIRKTKNENLYFHKPALTMPPLIVEDGIVIDGNHRLRVAKRKGVKEIIIYDIIPYETT